jgi:hypothetical protein
VLGSVVIVVKVFEFDWWDVAAVLVETSVVEPVDPFEGGDLDVLDGPPGPAWLDQFGLVEAVDRLGEGVVVAVARASDRGVDAGLDQSVGERDRGVLGGFNWWSQHRLDLSSVDVRRRLRRGCAIRGSCAVGY